MASSDKLTRAELRDIVKKDLMDATNIWWSNSEINGYVESWQDRVQEEHELIWGSATSTLTGTSTFTLTDIATDILRPARVIWNAQLLIPLDKQQLLELDKDWRAYGTRTRPLGVYQDDFNSFTVWPSIGTANVGTLVVEYPKELVFSSDAATMTLPSWTKYSVRSYAAFRAYLRRGPNADANKANFFKQYFYKQMTNYGKIKRKYFPSHYLRFKPGGSFEARLLDPIRELIPNYQFPEDVDVLQFADEVPTGTINGSNVTFTLTNTPSPVDSLELELDGLTLVKDTHYTLAAATITVTSAPSSGQTLFARYRYQG